MTTPSVSVRFAGSPLGAIALFGLSSAAIAGWYQGYVRAWVALVAAVMVFKTFTAIAQVRRYKQWRAKWDGFGKQGKEQTSVRRDHSWRRRFFLLIAVSLIFGILVLVSKMNTHGPHPLLGIIWLGAVAYVVVAGIRGLARKKTVKVRMADAAPAIAEWILPRAAGSPTREQVTHLLPDYCARLMQK